MTSAVRSYLHRARAQTENRQFRPEIQGLRALAVFMVASYHIWFGRVSGGVDVFLLISAFLMTQQFTRKYESGRKVSLPRHYLHVFRRLLPTALVVILAILVAARFLIASSRWESIITQGLSSLFYVENWTLKNLSVDYYAGNHALASPFQHFWSLSIQGQVFVLWPLIMVTVGVLARKARWNYQAALGVVFAVIFALSLTFSIWYTQTQQAAAYFDTFARLWEFALGSLLALALPYLLLPQRVRIVLGWVGIIAMLACGFVVDVQGAFPGYIALWPTLSAAAVIIAGDTQSRFGVDRVLASRPLGYLGGQSYALYLWHWPLLVFALVITGRHDAGFLLGLAIIVVAIGLAVLTTKYVEKPLREWSWPERRTRNSAVALVLMVVLAAVPLSLWRQDNVAKQQAVPVANASEYPGAKALAEKETPLAEPSPAQVQPRGERLEKDWATLPDECTGELEPEGGADILAACRTLPADGTPARKVLVVGHSHAQQMLAAIEPLATAQNWELTSTVLGGCPFAPDTELGNTQCDEFNRDVRAYINQIKPDLVITMATQSTPDSAEEQISEGFVPMVQDLAKQGIKVLGIRDNPRSSTNIAECALTKGNTATSCMLPTDDVLPLVPAYNAISRQVPTARFIDLTDLICSDEYCQPVIGNIRVYLDSNHLTATYAATLAPMFQQRFQALGKW